jgi:hypothetical protein
VTTTDAKGDALTPSERAILDAYEVEVRELYAPVRAALEAVEPAVAAASERCSRALEAVAPSGHQRRPVVARTALEQSASF